MLPKNFTLHAHDSPGAWLPFCLRFAKKLSHGEELAGKENRKQQVHMDKIHFFYFAFSHLLSLPPWKARFGLT